MNKSPLPISPLSWNIPIRLDISDGTECEMREGGTEHICGTCAVNSRHQPIHCVQISASPAPPSYHSVVATTSRDRLTIPTLTLQTSCGPSVPRAAHSALRYSTERRPRVRFCQDAPLPPSPCTTIDEIDNGLKVRASGSSIPNTPVDEDADRLRRRSKPGLGLGLGIPVAPFKPDPSPIRSPGSEKLARAEKGEPMAGRSPNVAQRIEEKLLEYSHSGNVIKRWLLEIISWTFSALCMSAIVVMLLVLSGHPAPNNWPFGLTLNVYIAIFSRISSAALVLPASEALGQLKWLWFQKDSKKMWDFELFDNASRGPWGSFLLLIRTKGTTLAALGATITIFAMALDPFFQQVVHYPPTWQLQTEPGTIPKLTRYEPDFVNEFKFETERIRTNQANPNPDFKHISDQYFFGYGIEEVKAGNVTRPNIPLSCPFGNCTWEPYETLGICSECADVADMLEFGCRQTQLDWIHNATTFEFSVNGTMCGWFLNATEPDPILMLGYRLDPITNKTREVLTTRSLPLITNLNRRPKFGGSINFKHIRNRLIDFIVVSPANGPDENKILDSIFSGEKPRAYECMLSMCVKRIESSYQLSTYTENVTHRFFNNTEGPHPWVQMRVNSTEISDAVTYLYLQNITINPTGTDNRENANGVSYGATNRTTANIIRVFDRYLPSFGIRESNTSETLMKYQMDVINATYRVYVKNPWSYPNNVTNHMERLATSLTDGMRFPSTENVTGKAFKQETLVEVRWPWLSLPVGLLVLTLVFLTATIVRTSAEKDRVGVWKNSAIANIIYGLPDRQKQKILGSQADGTPRTRAKVLHVRMLPTKDWRISGSLFSPSPSKPKPKTPTTGAPAGWI